MTNTTIPSSLHGIAIVYFIIFLAFLIGVGIWAGRQNKKGSKSKDVEFFLGGKTTPMFVLAMSYCASAVSAGSFIGDPGVMSTVGWPYYWIAVFIVPGLVIPGIPMIRRMRLQAQKYGSLTVSDYIAQRYQSKHLRTWLTILMVCCYQFMLVSQFKGAAVLLNMYTGMPFMGGLIVIAAVVLFYTNNGGLRSVAWTDFVQGCFMCVMSFTMICTALYLVGGFGGLDTILNRDYPEFNQLFQDGGWAGEKAGNTACWPGAVIGGLLFGFFVMFSQPYVISRYIALPDIKRESIGKFLLISLFTGYFFNLMFIVGMIGRTMFPDAEGDYMTVTFSASVYPPIISGFIMVGFFSAIISTATSILLVVGQAVGGDLYGRLFKNSTPEGEIRVTQGTTVVCVIIVFIFNMINTPDFLQIFIYLGLNGVGAGICMPLFCGVLYKKARKEAAWISAVLAPFSYVAWTQVLGYSWYSGMGICVIFAAIFFFVPQWILDAVKGPDKELMEWGDPFIDAPEEYYLSMAK